jgi:hypothetical protein
MPKADGFRNHAGRVPASGCPAPSLWGELAAGLIGADLAFHFLQHAGRCASCAEELRFARAAIEGSNELPEETRQRLVTAGEDWQMRFAEEIAARGIRGMNDEFDHEPPQPPSAPGRLLMRFWTRLTRGLKHGK